MPGRLPRARAQSSEEGARRPAYSDRRLRHLALLAVVLVVTVFGFILLQPRKVLLQADGREVVVETKTSSDEALLDRAGIELEPGDRVTELDGGDAEVLRVERARTVTLHADGVTYEIRTHAQSIDQLLDEASLAVGARDSVFQNGALVSMNAPVDPPRLFAVSPGAGGGRDVPVSQGIEIELRRALAFTIVEGGREVTSTSSRATVAQVLREAGIVVGPGDVVTPAPDERLTDGARIEVRHASAVTLALPEGHRVVYTLAATVGEVLKEVGVTLPEGAYVDPAPETAIAPGMSVSVIQLSAAADLEFEYIASGTVYEPDSSLPPGEARTVPGHDGVRVRRYEISYVNGEETGRALVEEYFDPPPVDTTIYYATRSPEPARPPTPVPPAAGQAGAKTLRVYATYYTPASSGRSPDDPDYGRTATGALVTYGIVAVDPTVIPLGTRMYIPGYGYAVAADTGGAVKGYIIDLGFPDGVDIDWTSRWLDIQILD